MKVKQYVVRNIRWARSTITNLNFRVGTVTIRKQRITVFENPGGGWLTASPGQFN